MESASHNKEYSSSFLASILDSSLYEFHMNSSLDESLDQFESDLGHMLEVFQNYTVVDVFKYSSIM